jgi:hypothetical protein
MIAAFISRIAVEPRAALSFQTEARRDFVRLDVSSKAEKPLVVLLGVLLALANHRLSSRCATAGLGNECISPGWLGLKSTAFTDGWCPAFFVIYHIFNLPELATLKFNLGH